MPLWVAGEEGVVEFRLETAEASGAGDWFGGRGAALMLEYKVDVLFSSGAGGGWGTGRSRLIVPTEMRA